VIQTSTDNTQYRTTNSYNDKAMTTRTMTDRQTDRLCLQLNNTIKEVLK